MHCEGKKEKEKKRKITGQTEPCRNTSLVWTLVPTYFGLLAVHKRHDACPPLPTSKKKHRKKSASAAAKPNPRIVADSLLRDSEKSLQLEWKTTHPQEQG